MTTNTTSNTHVAHALLALTSGSNLSRLAEASGLAPATLSKLISEGRRMERTTLQRLCGPGSPLENSMLLLLAHLRDEIDRAGRSQLDVLVQAGQHSGDDDIALLEEQSRDDHELRAIIHDLAELVRAMRRKAGTYPQTETNDRMVAED